MCIFFLRREPFACIKFPKKLDLWPKEQDEYFVVCRPQLIPALVLWTWEYMKGNSWTFKGNIRKRAGTYWFPWKAFPWRTSLTFGTWKPRRAYNPTWISLRKTRFLCHCSGSWWELWRQQFSLLQVVGAKLHFHTHSPIQPYLQRASFMSGTVQLSHMHLDLVVSYVTSLAVSCHMCSESSLDDLHVFFKFLYSNSSTLICVCMSPAQSWQPHPILLPPPQGALLTLCLSLPPSYLM